MDMNNVEVVYLVFERPTKVAGVTVRTRPPHLKVVNFHAIVFDGAVGWDIQIVRTVYVCGEDGHVVPQSRKSLCHPERGDDRPSIPPRRSKARYDVENLHQSARSIRNGPRAKTSMPVRSKQAIASSGVLTIGSRSLNDVLSKSGTPV